MPALRALLIQLAATLLATGCLFAADRLGWLAPSAITWALLQGGTAALLAAALHTERWWLLLHLAFAPGVVLALRWPVPPAVYLGLLSLSLLVFGLPFRTRVPLFLSSRSAVAVLAQWLPQGSYSIVDVGSGTGRFVTQMARLRNDCRVTGLELAWLPWAWSWLVTRRLSNAQVGRKDFWQHSLEPYEVVYAFLSPVPMPALWDKARREQRAGSWLISNSFVVPGVQATGILEVNDRRRTRLYCYRIPTRQDQSPQAGTLAPRNRRTAAKR